MSDHLEYLCNAVLSILELDDKKLEDIGIASECPLSLEEMYTYIKKQNRRYTHRLFRFVKANIICDIHSVSKVNHQVIVTHGEDYFILVNLF